MLERAGADLAVSHRLRKPLLLLLLLLLLLPPLLLPPAPAARSRHGPARVPGAAARRLFHVRGRPWPSPDLPALRVPVARHSAKRSSMGARGLPDGGCPPGFGRFGSSW
ncbi:hypothetical protein [Streptomyces sp. NPDC057690]|uniref:hypothetical protein n=1 Tax=Streptomyces sp. NPDC057690 TaxID=3346214 RepID=UPI00369B9379